jgi:aminopeptidase N
MTLQALRERVGDRDFFTILRRWTRQHAHGSVRTEQFVGLAERVSGQQLDRFFHAWLYAPRKPRGY